MTEPLHRVEAYTATVEHPSGPPPVNWKAMDDFDPSWLLAIAYIFGGCLALRFMLFIFGFYGCCIVFWLLATVASYGMAGFLANPFYCIIMASVAGSITWFVLTLAGELITAPGKIWWKITR